jgi:cell shape-determining protein MreC
MKRTFLAKRNALLSSAGVSWGAFALACAILVLLARLLAPNLFWHAFAPVFHVADTIAAKNDAFFNSFSDTAKLALHNEELVNENTALTNENQALLQKTIAQGALLGAPATGRNKTPGILAGVVVRPPESPYDTLTLAEGSHAGVTLGQEAFGPGSVPLGVVSAVLADFSRVTLFSAPGMATNGWIGHAALPLTILGAGAGVMNAFLSRAAGAVIGDVVFAPGPGMFPIGSVTRIDSDPSAPGVTLRIMPALNLFSLTWVELRDVGKTVFTSATSTP